MLTLPQNRTSSSSSLYFSSRPFKVPRTIIIAPAPRKTNSMNEFNTDLLNCPSSNKSHAPSSFTLNRTTQTRLSPAFKLEFVGTDFHRPHFSSGLTTTSPLPESLLKPS
ncbi:hypothetical protein LINPERPRIM_LOCUS21031 [Linum perenne]